MKKFLPTLIIACAVHIAGTHALQAAPLKEKVKIAQEQPSQQTGTININKASADQLESIPGVGTKKAQAIIDYRSKNGNFASVDDLVNVKGIGKKMMDKMKGSISI